MQNFHETQIGELEENMKELMGQVQILEAHNKDFREAKDRIEKERDLLETEREEEKKIVQEALEMAMEEKRSIQERWERDFEKLRTVNTGREQQLLDDFEWKLREVEQSCKRRLEEKDKAAEEKIKEAFRSVEDKVKSAEAQLNEVVHLKSYEAEVRQLRGLTEDQQTTLRTMSDRVDRLQASEESLRDEISKLKRQIECEKGKLIYTQHQHEVQLVEKSREMQVQLEKQRGDIAEQWEERLHKECKRLKSEMEQIHNEEKTFAVEAIKMQKQQEYDHLKQIWENRLEESNKEV